MKDVLVSIVNHEHGDLLPLCLDSVRRNTEGIAAQVTVLDNASTDGSAEMIRRRYPDVELIAQEHREGFGANHNTILGRHLPDVRHVLLLNDDACLEEGALRAMLSFMDANPSVGIAGPRLVYPDGTPQSSYAALPTVWDEVFYLWGLGRLVPKSSRRRLARLLRPLSRPLPKMGRVYLENWFAVPAAPIDVDWVCGACMMARAETVRRIGLLDARSFFMYFEDVDWCRRAAADGWRVTFLPNAVVRHYQQGSRSAVTARAWVRSALQYFRKYGRSSDASILRMNVWAKAGLAAGAWTLASALPPLRARARREAALQRGLLEGCREERRA